MITAANARDALSVVRSLYGVVDREPLFPTLRAGVHAGSCVHRDADYFGATVNLAARVADHARAGQMAYVRNMGDHRAES